VHADLEFLEFAEVAHFPEFLRHFPQIIETRMARHLPQKKHLNADFVPSLDKHDLPSIPNLSLRGCISTAQFC